MKLKIDVITKIVIYVKSNLRPDTKKNTLKKLRLIIYEAIKEIFLSLRHPEGVKLVVKFYPNKEDNVINPGELFHNEVSH